MSQVHLKNEVEVSIEKSSLNKHAKKKHIKMFLNMSYSSVGYSDPTVHFNYIKSNIEEKYVEDALIFFKKYLDESKQDIWIVDKGKCCIKDFHLKFEKDSENGGCWIIDKNPKRNIIEKTKIFFNCLRNRKNM